MIEFTLKYTNPANGTLDFVEAKVGLAPPFLPRNPMVHLFQITK